MSIRDIAGQRNDSSNTQTNIKASKEGALWVAQYLPAYALLNAKGVVFGFDTSAGTAKTCVEAMPTTSPEWGLYNSSSDKMLVLLHVAAISQSGTMGLGLAVVGAAAIGVQTVVAADYNGATKTCLNGSGNVPQAFVTNNPTLIGGTPSWVAFDLLNQTSAIAVGTGVKARIDGLLMCPPGGLVGLEVVGLTGTTALYDINGIFAMIDFDGD